MNASTVAQQVFSITTKQEKNTQKEEKIVFCAFHLLFLKSLHTIFYCRTEREKKVKDGLNYSPPLRSHQF